MIEGILRNNVVLVLIIQIASGCTSLRPLPDEKNALEHAVGQEMEFPVTQIANERIEGPRQGVAMDDIAKIEHREFSVWKTVTLIALILIFGAATGGGGGFAVTGT